QIRVLNQAAPEGIGDAGKSLHGSAPVPVADSAQDAILDVGFVLQLGADVIVEGGGERRAHDRFARIVIGDIACRFFVLSLEPAVVSSHGSLLAAQKLLGEMCLVYAQVGLIDVGLRESRVLCKMVNHVLTFGGGQGVSLCERRRIMGYSPLFNLAKGLLQ